MTDLFRALPLGAQGAEAEGVVAFGQANAVLIGQQRAVKEGWSGQAESTVEEQLPSGGPEQVLPPNHLGDVHGRIIHHHGQLVRRQVIVTPDHEISEVSPGAKPLSSAAAVLEGDHFAVRNPEPPVHPLTGGDRKI